MIEPIEGGAAVRIHVESEADFLVAVEFFNQNNLDTIIRAHPQLTFTAEYSEGSGSPLPAISNNGNKSLSLIFDNSIIWAPEAPVSNDVSLFRIVDPFLAEETLKFFVGAGVVADGGQDRAENSDSSTQAFSEHRSSILFFDHIFDAVNTSALVAGVNAVCADDCIDATGSQVYVVDSEYECEGTCVDLKGASEETGAFDFQFLRTYWDVLGLTDEASMRRMAYLDSIEPISQDADVAVVDAILESGSKALRVDSSDEDAVPARVHVQGSRLSSVGNDSSAVDLRETADGGMLLNSIFSAASATDPVLDTELGSFTTSHLLIEGGEDGIRVTDAVVTMAHNAVTSTSATAFKNQEASAENSASNMPQASCTFSSGSGVIQSLGYNITSDDGCALAGVGDQENTNPGLSSSSDGPRDAQFSPGSAALDGGASQPVNGQWTCAAVDMHGVARPQDGNGDGVFECDVGPVEALGGGEITGSHSAAFYNAERDGEGTYVEILENGLGVVYTFTYAANGSGPAWTLAVGDVSGNSFVSNEVLITSGTGFGDNFDSNDVMSDDFGQMNMVFPDCEAAANPGNVIYTGNADIGYEAVTTKATRLSQIIGCDGSKADNAGFSGSFFDAGRSGEGIIVEWLTDGRVLVMFFTYGVDGGQMWIFGSGTANGNSVTIEALYPTSFSQWGSDFDSADVAVSDWGTLTLEFSDCDNLTFSYDSTVPGYGAATRHYTRLSKLRDTECPM